MKNLPLFENFDQYYKLDERFEDLYESSSDNFKFLVSRNQQLMRRIFNQMSNKGYVLSSSVYIEELTPKDAAKIKVPNTVKFWLDSNGIIQIVTIDNEVMDTNITKKDTKSLSKSRLPYFYQSQFFGSKEGFDYIQQNGAKIKPFLLSCDKVYAFPLSELTKKGSMNAEDKINQLVNKYATKYKIPVYQGSILTEDEMMNILKDSSKPAYVINPKTNQMDSRNLFATNNNITGVTEESIKSLMRDFILRVPLKRGFNHDATMATVEKIPGATKYEIRLSFDRDYNYNVLPNVAVIQSVFDDNNISISDSYYCQYFASFSVILGDSPKEAKMATMDWWSAFVNVGPNSEEFKKALADAAPVVKRLAAQVGDKTLLLAKDGNTDKPEFKQFFTDILMYKTKAENLPGKQIDIYTHEKSEKKILFQ